ncbi:hypothetical protein AB0L06_32120 [Spirillospora sp. NPDC052269]
MTKIVDYGTFADRLKAAPNRWHVLREFFEEWGCAVDPDWDRWDRGAEDEQETAGALSGEPGDEDGLEDDDTPPIPDAVFELWDLPLDSYYQYDDTNMLTLPLVRFDPSSNGDPGPLQDDSDLVAPGSDRRVCVFLAEHQYCNEWGYLAAEAHEPDPRVLVSVGDERWVLQARSVSEFFLQLAVQRLPRRLGWSTRIRDEEIIDGDEDDLRARIAERMPELGFEPWAELERYTIVYGGPDVLVFVADGELGGIDFAGRTAQAVLDLAERLGVKLAEEELGKPGQY